MAATAPITYKEDTFLASKKVVFVQVNCTSYDSSGITFTPGLVGLRYIDYAFITPIGAAAANAPVVYNWDSANNLILAYDTTNHAANSGAAFTINVMAIGS